MQKLVAKTEVAFDIVGEEVGGGAASGNRDHSGFSKATLWT
jgi:hypothetical protein